MKIPAHMSARIATIGAIVLTAVAASIVALSALAADARAVSQPLLPFRCFAQVGVDHVVFGPESFFLPKTVQGPTSFTENAGPTTVTYPFYRGTSQGRDVRYVITDASTRSAAEALGVNYVPKLAQAAGTSAVQSSTSDVGSGNGIDFSHLHRLLRLARCFQRHGCRPAVEAERSQLNANVDRLADESTGWQ